MAADTGQEPARRPGRLVRAVPRLDARRRPRPASLGHKDAPAPAAGAASALAQGQCCLLYTSDAADDM
eukprot:7224350-Lingulodinium_polyedra.AAC.1